MRVLTIESDLSIEWLSEVLGQTVVRFDAKTEASNWATQIPIQAMLSDGTVKALRLKLCRGETFGRSEVDYHTRDYAGLENAPLVRCLRPTKLSLGTSPVRLAAL